MIDLLDILAGRASETNPATYYDNRPDGMYTATGAADLFSLDNGGTPFDYEIIDPTSYQLRSLFGDVTDRTGRQMAIKTRDAVDFRVGGFVATDDDILYTVDAVTVDTSASNKQVMRFIPVPLESVRIVRLVEVENLNRVRRG